MDNIFLLLAFFAVVKSLFMTTLLPDRRYRIAFSLLLGVFVVLSHPYVVELNKLQVQRMLSERSALFDISLVVMVDSLLTVYFCLARLRDREPGQHFAWYTTLVRHMPSLLIFPALFYLHINLLFSLPGVAFTTVTWGLAAGVVAVFVAASLFARSLIGGKDLLIELIMLLTLLLFLLTVCSAVFHPSNTVISHSAPVDWLGCLGTLGLLLVLTLVGWLLTAVRRRLQKKS